MVYDGRVEEDEDDFKILILSKDGVEIHCALRDAGVLLIFKIFHELIVFQREEERGHIGGRFVAFAFEDIG